MREADMKKCCGLCGALLPEAQVAIIEEYERVHKMPFKEADLVCDACSDGDDVVAVELLDDE